MTVKAVDLVERVRAAQPSAVRLVIYRLPSDLLALAPISASSLPTFPDVGIEEIADARIIASAIDAIVASDPRPVDGFLDARFGLVFSNASGETVLEVYKGAFVSRGQIDEQVCVYDEAALYQWLRERYPS
jgi:hypothetical protein